MPKREICDVDLTAIKPMLERAEKALSEDDFRLVEGISTLVVQAVEVLRKASASLARMRRVFGLGRSEKTATLKADAAKSEVDAPPPAAPKDDARAADESAAPASPTTVPTPDASNASNASNAPDAPAPPPKKKRKGHGRLPASAYRGAQHILVNHTSLECGDPCPDCTQGKIHPLSHTPVVRIVGQAPLMATCWDCERFRCGDCGKIFTARLPPEAQGEKYDETAGSMLGVLHCGTGVPFHRIAKLQGNLDIPVPASTQWDIVRERAELVLPAHTELVRLAAQAEILHNDDSHMRILSLMGKRRAKLVAEGVLEDPERKGIFTTAIIAVVASVGTIALFCTGRKHAGENLADLLQKRDPGLPTPLLMSDALARNVPEGHDVIEANCVAHGRRKVVDEVANFPAQCLFLLDRLALVYKVDNDCKKRSIVGNERLRAHQRDSAPIMDELQKWMTSQLTDKLIEPNSGLGDAFNYFLKRWDKFTVFLRVPGAPLDNNICERGLKMAIKLRKASLFYRSERGARVGDIYMTLIHTAELHHQNPFDYLTELQRNYNAVAETPADWLPWNYKDTLARRRQAHIARAAEAGHGDSSRTAA